MVPTAQILIVEDDEDLRFVVEELLVDLGYRVASVSDGRAALEYLHGHAPPSIIVLDLVMPRMDGAEFCRQRRRHRALSSIPVFLFTGTASTHRQIARLGVHRVLRKPLVVSELIDAVANVLPRSPDA